MVIGKAHAASALMQQHRRKGESERRCRRREALARLRSVNATDTSVTVDARSRPTIFTRAETNQTEYLNSLLQSVHQDGEGMSP